MTRIVELVVSRQRRSSSVAVLSAVFVVLSWSPLARAEKPHVTALAFTSAGDRAIIGSQAGLQVLAWPTLKVRKTLTTKLEHIHDVAFSPDGKRMAVAGGVPSEEGLVEVFSWPEGRLLFRTSCHDDLIYRVAWSADGTKLATAGTDHVSVLLGGKTGKRLRAIRGHSRGVTAVCFLPGGDTLVTAGVDQSVRVWSLPEGKPIRTLNNHTKMVHDLALRPLTTGLPMIATTSDDRTVRLWQPTIGRMVRFVRLPTAALDVAWSTDGKQIYAACRDGRVRVIDPDTVEVKHDLPAVRGWAYSLAVHPKDRELLIGGERGQLQRVKIPPLAE
jgi:WD40 repeat protein